MSGDGYALTPIEEEALKKEREEFRPFWDEWHEAPLDGARQLGIPQELADDPRTLHQLYKLLQTAHWCQIPLGDAKRELVLDLLHQLKQTGAPPPVQ